jgi:hypothetical protein
VAASLTNQIVNFEDVDSTPAAFILRGGLYAVTIIATWGGGSVTLQRLARDGTTYVTVTTAFSDDAYVSISLPPGTYRLLMATATAMYADVTSITFGV